MKTPLLMIFGVTILALSYGALGQTEKYGGGPGLDRKNGGLEMPLPRVDIMPGIRRLGTPALTELTGAELEKLQEKNNETLAKLTADLKPNNLTNQTALLAELKETKDRAASVQAEIDTRTSMPITAIERIDALAKSLQNCRKTQVSNQQGQTKNVGTQSAK